MPFDPESRARIAIVGSGISGLAAAWLLAKRYRVTLFEADDRVGGHSNTVDVSGQPVDTGFIVYNERTYPNLTAMFAHLDVPTKSTEMSFSVSLDGGRLEYSGSGLRGLLAQPGNLFRPRFWSMLRDLLRFYRLAPDDLARLSGESLGDYLDARGFRSAFREDHIFPMAAAIWSSPASDIPSYPAASFIRFCENHALLQLADRPVWRTVSGGSREYVRRLTSSFVDRIERGRRVHAVRRNLSGVTLQLDGEERHFDQLVIATHADQALKLLIDPDQDERRLLGAFRYTQNEAVLHGDASLMPTRRRAWASWNYAGDASNPATLSVTYWMNRLQHIPGPDLFVTLNPWREPDASTVFRRETYDHPVFDQAAVAAQRQLWSLQGRRSTWYCGAYFGAGFHEDGLQAGLAVAEQLGQVRRPWSVDGESDRIPITAPMPAAA